MKPHQPAAKTKLSPLDGNFLCSASSTLQRVHKYDTVFDWTSFVELLRNTSS